MYCKLPLLIQGIYFLITGLWPIFHIRSFMAVTGPKTDQWLVKTVGVLISVIALVLLLSYWQNECTITVAVLAAGSSAGLTAIDLVYSLKGRISKIYLADAVIQIILLAFWSYIFMTGL
jgi:hypothetical protein